MGDRTLLEMAAKSAGVDVHESDDGTIQCRPILAVYHYVQGQPYSEHEWNPLREDADCARMEVACRIGINWFDARVTASVEDAEGDQIECSESFANGHNNHDPNAARRRASTRAAAALQGKQNG